MVVAPLDPFWCSVIYTLQGLCARDRTAGVCSSTLLTSGLPANLAQHFKPPLEWAWNNVLEIVYFLRGH